MVKRLPLLRTIYPEYIAFSEFAPKECAASIEQFFQIVSQLMKQEKRLNASNELNFI